MKNYYANVQQSGGVTNVIPQRLSWQGQQTEFTPGDVGFWYQAGVYEYNDPDGLVQELDFNAADPDDIFYRLRYNNQFGNNARFTTSTGIIANNGRANFTGPNWAAEVAAGGIDKYVIDHLTGIGYITDKITITQNWVNSIAAVHTLVYGGFSDWRALNRIEVQSIVPFAINTRFYSSDCILTRGTTFVSGIETQMWLGDTSSLNTASANNLADGGSIGAAAKTNVSSIRSIFACRRHF